MTITELKSIACPFCGSHDISEGEVLTSWAGKEPAAQSMCNACGACGPEAQLEAGEVDYGDVKAIAAWNRRALLSEAADVAAVRDAALEEAAQYVGKMGNLVSHIAKAIRALKSQPSPQPSVGMQVADAREESRQIKQYEKWAEVFYRNAESFTNKDYVIGWNAWNAALASSTVSVPEWLPIESAPKDGTEFMAWCGGFEPRCRINEDGAFQVWDRIDYDQEGWDYVHSTISPTHWQPRPIQPSSNTEPT